MPSFTHFKDCKEWLKWGIPIGTTSNEAAKHYDAALTQWHAWYDDERLGGFEGSIKAALEADPDFTLVNTLMTGLEVMGSSIPDHPPLRDKVKAMVAMGDKPEANKFERLHIKAVEMYYKGKWEEAELTWTSILMDYPRDPLALKFVWTLHFLTGEGNKIRDCMARVIPHWDQNHPLYGYLLGIYSFGLVESGMYPEAEKQARKGLEYNADDSWSTHALAHTLEMTGRYKEGLNMMNSTVKEWKAGNMLCGHNSWHNALFYIENNDFDGAFDIFDNVTHSRLKDIGSLMDVTDASSLLWRLEIAGANVEDRWEVVSETCEKHMEDITTCFRDVHVLMGLAGAKKFDNSKKMLQAVQELVSNGVDSYPRNIYRDVGQKLCESIDAYSQGDYARTVERLYPVRYKVVRIGGSHAQRDVFSMFLIDAATKSPLKEHNRLARQLLVERKALVEKSTVTDILNSRLLACHDD